MIRTETIDPNRVAEIIVISRSGSEWRGSGYRVSARGILTVAHVIADATSVRVRFNARRPDERIESAAVAWVNVSVDIAVLAIKPGDAETVDPVWFGRIADRDAVIECRTMGFPLFKRRPDTQFRDSYHAVGTIALLSNRKAGELEINLTPAPAQVGDSSPWPGMSGAAIWSRGRIIGLVGKHYDADGPGRLTGIRIDGLYERIGQAELEEFCGLTGLPGQVSELDDVLPPDEASLLEAGHAAAVRDIAPVQLREREDELAEMTRFCFGNEPYLWWQGPPWAGKTALASWFVLHPPAGVSTVSFFITRRLAGHADSEAFTSAMLEQLAALAGQTLAPLASPGQRDRERLRLLELAAVKVSARGGQLVLVIDGLDEDTGAAPGSTVPSIASLLPRRPPAGTRVIVTSRPSPGIPADVLGDHPLRSCTPHQLTASQHAIWKEVAAKAELTGLLNSGQAIQVDLIGLIAAAGGNLTLDELAELTKQPEYLVDSVLAGTLGRSVGSRTVPGPGGSAARIYLFTHETLAKIAEEQLGRDLLRYRERIHAWADSYRERGWPVGSPQYLLRPYGQMLARIADLGRLVQLATDYARHDLMLAVSFGDETALAEITAARDMTMAQPSLDLVPLALFGVSTDRLSSRNSDVPADLPATWARLGQPQRATAVARSIFEPFHRSEALAGLAEALGPRDLDAALAAASAAQQAALAPASIYGSRDPALVRIVKALTRLHRFEAAEEITRSMTSDYCQAESYTALAVAVDEFGAEDARRLAVAGLDAVRRCEDPLGRARLAAELAADLTSIDPEATRQTVLDAEQATRGMEELFWRIQALAAIVKALAAIDTGQAVATAEAASRTAADLNDPREQAGALEALVTAVAPVDLDVARRMAGQVQGVFRSHAGTEYFTLDGVPSSAVRALAITRQWDAARDVLAQAPWGPFGYEHALSSLAAALGRSGMWEAAEQTARSISGSGWEQSDTLLWLSQDLVSADQIDKAERVAASITDGARRAKALAAVASAQVPLDAERARRTAEAAERTARQEARPSWHDQTLAELVGALTEQLQWERAERIALTMTQDHYRDQALAELIGGLACADRTDDVMRLYQKLSGPAEVPLVLAGIAAALCVGQHWDDAEEMASRITDPSMLTQALAAIATALAPHDLERGRRAAERAEQAARTVPSFVMGGPNNTDATLLVVEALAAVRRWDAAEEIARPIEAPHPRSRALAVLAGSLAAVDPERARSIGREAIELATGAEAIALVAQSLRLVDQAWALSTAEAAVNPALALTDSLQRASGLARIVTALIAILGAETIASGSAGRAGGLAGELIGNVLAGPHWSLGLRAATRINPFVCQVVSAAILGELTIDIKLGSERTH